MEVDDVADDQRVGVVLFCVHRLTRRAGSTDRMVEIPSKDLRRKDGYWAMGKMANGTAWAVTAFSTTSFMLGLYNAGLVDPRGIAVVLPVAFFFGGMMQILVAILEIFAGNPFGATVFGSYGPFWVILGAINVWFARSIPSTAMGSAMAVFLAMWAVISFYFFVASLPLNRVLSAILALITIALVLLSLGAGLPSVFLTRIGGWVTLIFATLGWYYAFAHLLQFTFERDVLPLGVVLRKPDQTAHGARSAR